MRLYLCGKSKNNLGYTPDWMKVSFKNENAEDVELTLDIRGEIDFEKDSLDCRVKGEFVPWVFYNQETGEETDLEIHQEMAKEFTDERVFNLIKDSETLTVGLYPTDDSNPDYNEDEVVGIEGSLEMCVSENDIRTVPFKNFETEINL